MFRRITSGLIIALAAACGGAPRPQNQSASPLPDPNPGYELTRRFPGAAKRIFRGGHMTFAEASDAAQPDIKSLVHKELGLGAFELGEETVRQSGDTYLIGYDVRFQGICLSTASADALVGIADSAVRRLCSRNVPKAGVDGIQNTVPRELALAIARGHSARATGVPPESARLETSAPELVFEAGRSESDKAQLCWLLRVRVDDDVAPHHVEYAIKAIGEPVVVRAQSLIKEDHFGTVRGVRWERTPLPTTEEEGVLPFARLSRTSPPATSDADSNGRYRFPGTGSATVKGVLASSFFRINNRSASVGQLEPTTTGSDAGAIDLRFAGTHEHEIAQVSAFVWAHRARTFARAALGDSDLLSVEVRVNIDGACSSFFDPPVTLGGSPIIRLFRSNPDPRNPATRCANRAYADTIFHEYGHALDWHLGSNGGAGLASDAYSEGFADALAILVTQSTCYGRDANGPNSCLRSADNGVVWPASGVTERHQVGQIYSGFVLELVRALTATMTKAQAYALAQRLIIETAKDNPRNIQQAVEYTIAKDDDDGDPRNGTPHLAAIRQAAQKKKLWKAEWDPKT